MKSLSARLLALTIVFVMMSEFLIYAPSIGRFRKVWLEERLDEAHLAILALEATPDGMVDAGLQMRLLAHVGTVGITLYRADGRHLMLGPDMPKPADATVDLRQQSFIDYIVSAFHTLFEDGTRLLKVVGPSPRDDHPLIEALLPEAPLRRAMLDYSQRILLLSLFISIITAALLYAAVHRLLVRPMRRLTASMLAFREAPEDARRTIVPSRRDDEIGTAETALAEMQRDLRAALAQKTRLAAVGGAVAKISHDLKGILSSAVVVSERLEASGNAEVQRLAPTLVKSIDRAVHLCTDTLQYVREGPPAVRPHRFEVAALLAELDAESHDIACRSRAAAGVSIEADRELLYRTLRNLVRNAAEAGAASIAITAEGNGDWLDLIVADDGPGLPAKARDNLFRAFAASARPGGTGLGLAIAHELTLAQGGRLELQESGAGGTRFRIRLPFGGR